MGRAFRKGGPAFFMVARPARSPSPHALSDGAAVQPAGVAGTGCSGGAAAGAAGGVAWGGVCGAV